VSASVQAPAFRAATSFGANIVRAAISFVTTVAIARTLGASSYGNLAFLLSTFTALALLLDFGTSNAFYTLLSMRRRGARFFIVYALWTIGIQFVAVFLMVSAVLTDRAIGKIWPGNDRWLVLLSLIASFVTAQVWVTMTQMAEAARKTLFIQIISTIQAALHLALVIAVIVLKTLSIPVLLILPIIEYVALAIAVAPDLVRANRLRPREPGDYPPESFPSVIADFWTYCKPLIAYSVVGFAYQFADRWLLQRFGGSMQQGYFAIGQQFASIAILAVASILNVFWKEIAEAKEVGDHERVVKIFDRVRHVMFFSTAVFSCILVVYSPEILAVLVGPQYARGALCLAIMFLYPVHQSLGHVQSTFCLATSETQIYTFIGIGNMLLSIPLAYLVLAPPSADVPGLGLGAAGIAGKLVLLQVVSVTVQLELLARRYPIRRDYGYQAAVLAGLLSLGAMCKFGFSPLRHIGGLAGVVAWIGAGMLAYALVIGALTWRFPRLSGLNIRDVAFMGREHLRFFARPT